MATETTNERRFPWCEGIDQIELISVDQKRVEDPRHYLEYGKGHRGADDGPYRLLIPSKLMQWLLAFAPAERRERALHVLRVHMGEEPEMAGCPKVPRKA